MPFDYKKEYREFYLPPKKPHLITIPRMNFVAVHGKGDPAAMSHGEIISCYPVIKAITN